MPGKFERCVKNGGRVRTLKPRGRCDPLYIPICRAPGSRRAVAGEPRYASKVAQDCGKPRKRRRR